MPLKQGVTPQDVINLLNRALKNDPAAMNQLVNARVICNPTMAHDPTIQVGKRTEGGYRLGILGILNGIFGIDDETHYGVVGAKYDQDVGLIEEFALTDFEAVKARQDVQVDAVNAMKLEDEAKMIKGYSIFIPEFKLYWSYDGEWTGEVGKAKTYGSSHVRGEVFPGRVGDGWTLRSEGDNPEDWYYENEKGEKAAIIVAWRH